MEVITLSYGKKMGKRNEDGETSKIHPVREDRWIEICQAREMPSHPGRHPTSAHFSTHISFLTERAAL